MTEETGLAAELIDLRQVMDPVTAGMTESPDPVAFAIACGAALGHLTKTRTDFRQDFMPYQGKKLLLEKTIKVLSISVTLMLLAVGLYFQLRLYKANSYLNTLHKNLQTEYAAVMGKLPPSDKTVQSILNTIKSEQIRVEKVKSGQLSVSGEAAISAMLTYVIEALNSAPPQVQPNIDYITVAAKSIIMAGDTANRDATLALINAIDAHQHLKVSQSSFDFKSNRDQFRFTILLREAGRK